MSEKTNKYGLTRYIGVDIIEKLRKEVNYVCPACDVKNGPCSSLFLTWHHFDPPFKYCREHNPKGIIALCPTHASRADRRMSDKWNNLKKNYQEKYLDFVIFVLNKEKTIVKILDRKNNNEKEFFNFLHKLVE